MGRLIDEDFVKRRMHETMDYQDLYLPAHFEMCMRDAPTIAAPRWVRCEERLPDDGDTVLIYCETTGGIVKSHFREIDGRTGKIILFSGGTHHPTHWMPLPEPPKEETK